VTVGAAVAGLYFVHPDHLNTPRLIADATQTTVWKWEQQEPFGNNVPNEDPDGNSQNFEFNLRFPGQYFDKETNLAYNYFRDYDPAVGRYIQSDPVGFQGGINTYAYVGSNALSFVDPLGLQAIPFPITPPIAGPNSGASGNIARGLNNLINKIIDICTPDDKTCPPCKTVSGKIVPVGTISYRPMDTPSTPQHGIAGPHYNLYKANQYPAPKCDCFWQSIGAVPPSGLPAGAIPIEPFAN
jgi:RHS repeat-associated protein